MIPTRSENSPHFARDSRWSALVAAAVIAAAVTGCTSPGETPGGLTDQHSDDRPEATTPAPVAVPGTFLAGKRMLTPLGSTTPANGDENPYAIWPVTQTVGSVRAGDVLVDNFNNKSNNQGTGTTIVDVHPDGQLSVFATLPNVVPGCPGGVGLTTAMVVLHSGWVIVGSLPSTDGKIDTAGQGCLLELSPTGQLGGVISGPYLNGPWDATVSDDGDSATLFVTNTLVGVATADGARVNQGSVVRLELSEPANAAPAVTGTAQIGDSFPEQADAGAFVKGPTGLALDPSGTLYVADNLGNRIAAIPNALHRADSAGAGSTLTSGGALSNPLGLTLTPSGTLIAANATNGKVVELTAAGAQVGEYYAIPDVGQDPPGNGDLFGIAINQAGTGLLFVKDNTNTLAMLH